MVLVWVLGFSAAVLMAAIARLDSGNAVVLDSIWQGVVRPQGWMQFGFGGVVKSLGEAPTIVLMRLAVGYVASACSGQCGYIGRSLSRGGCLSSA